MIIHSDINNLENNEKDLEKICLMCHDDLNEPNDDSNELNETVKLNCSHKYHYKCILMTYKSNKSSGGGKRECPYCRGKGGFLELKKGMVPQHGINKEYKDYINGTFNLEDIEYIEGKCIHILKTGKNSGTQCTCKPKSEENYCGRHLKMH